MKGIQLASAITLGTLACSPAPQRPAIPGDAGPVATDAGAAPFYGPCPGGFSSECSYVPLPLDWSRPMSRTIDVFMSHQPAAGDPQQQLWLLAGGPGESAEVFATILPALARRMPNAELFVMEHRGVGESVRLTCSPPSAAPDGGGSSAGATWEACAQALGSFWGDDLGQFNTSNAARDLQALIAATRVPGRPVYIFGVSYGTFLALRFLRLFPDAVDGVVLDSVVPPDKALMSHYDEWTDPVLQKISDLCAADGACRSKMGDDPLALVRSVVDHPCTSSTLSRSQISATLALLAESRSLRDGLLPLVYRLNRCAPSDVNAIGYASGTLNQLLLDAPGSQRESGVLKMQIALSEMWEDPSPTPAELIARCDSSYACPGFGPVAAIVEPIWPRYPEPLAGMWPQTHIPILAMHGELDTRAPIELARSFSDAMRDPEQVFVGVPYSTHSVVLNSLRASIPGDTCGADLLQGFVTSGGHLGDLTCLGDLVPLRFDSNPTLARRLFNRNDLWEDE